MPETYLAQLAHFLTFLHAYVHTLLYLRALYPTASFVRTRIHNTPVYQSRHPAVCAWVRDALSAVHTELLNGSVSRVAIVVFSIGAGNAGGNAGSGSGSGSGSVNIMERYMLDVSAFPVVPKSDRNMDIEWEGPSSASPSPPASPSEPPSSPRSKGKAKQVDKPVPVDSDAPVDLSEQFRAALMMLHTRASSLKPLPKNCSFNISMELKDEADIDPPVGHPQAWIPVQPSLQKTGRKGQENHDGHTADKGEDLGGAKVTPIRAVEAGVFRFETWVEEGKDKFRMLEESKTSSLSSE